MTKREALTYLRDYAKGYCDKNGEKIPPHSFDLNRETTDILEDAIIASMKHGRWIEIDDELITGTCSVCGWDAIFAETDVVGMPYCPNCGAYMKGEEG